MSPCPAVVQDEVALDVDHDGDGYVEGADHPGEAGLDLHYPPRLANTKSSVGRERGIRSALAFKVSGQGHGEGVLCQADWVRATSLCRMLHW